MVWRCMVLVLAVSVCGVPGCGTDGDACVPQCDGLACGDDGCGGLCGECETGSVCSVGECVECQPACTGRMCGPDGCGGHCGLCDGGQVCHPDFYLCSEKPDKCKPVCNDYGYDCGPDGCGGECGDCSPGVFCQPDSHTCLPVCKPKCSGKECGDDGCGSLCGTCSSGMECQAGQCKVSNVLPPDDFRILFGYQGRIPGVNETESDLYLLSNDGMNPLKPEDNQPQPLTSFSLQGAADCQLIAAEDGEGNPTQYEACSCKYGCFVDHALKWIAVSVKKPTADGFTFQVGRFNSQLKVAMVKGVYIKNVVDFKFAGDYLYYSRLLACQGARCQYTLYRQPLDPPGPEQELFVFPPEDDPDWPTHSNYRGHFKASRDGSSLVVLGTTIRSVRIYLWRQGVLKQLDYVCSQMVAGQCIGAGSEYSDQDPVAMSSDGTKIAVFNATEKEFRLRVYDAVSLNQKSLVLFAVSQGTWITDACTVVRSIPWSFRTVLGDPVFSLDGSMLYFLAHNNCDASMPGSRVHTNILGIDLSAVGDGTPFEETDFINVTRNPRSNGTENIIIDSFDLSPTGVTVVLAASPRTGNGQPLAADSDRARRDREIWVVGSGGAGLKQLTDSSRSMARSPMALDSSVTSAFRGQ